jgi:hypothetical protein
VRRWVSFAVLVFAVAAPAARAVPLGGTVLVDRPTGFGALPFDGFAQSSVSGHSLSADGRYAVFSSESNDLISGAEQSATNVYRVDLTTGAIVQVDTTTGGGQPTPGSDNDDASISADGNYVGFETTSPAIDPAASADAQQFVVKNITTGAIEDASVGNGATGAAVTSLDAGVLSGDGRHVAFTAESAVVASNATGVSGQTDAYLRSLDANTTEMVSVTSTGAEGGGVRSAPDIDYAGDAVSFATTSTLVPADTNSGEDAYVRDVAHEQTLLVSFSSGQTPGAVGGFDVAVAGQTGALDLAWDNGNEEWFAPCSTACTTAAVRVDHAKTGGEDDNDNAGAPFFPPESNGNLPTRVYFSTFQALDPADTNNAFDIYGWDIGNTNYDTSIHLMTPGTEANGAEAGSATQSGSVTVFGSSAPTLPGADGQYEQAYADQAGTITDISQPFGQPVRIDAAGSAFVSTVHATSDDGHLVSFESGAPVFGVTFGSNEANDQILARNVVNGQTQLVSAVSGGTAPGNASSEEPSVDAAGDKIAFESAATNLVPGLIDANGSDDVFVRNLLTGQTSLVDRTDGGGVPLRGAGDPKISADGTKVVFISRSADIPGSPADDNEHVYEVDLATGNVTLIDQTTGGAPANGDARDVDVDGNGQRVAFVSDAASLGGGTEDSTYVRDLTNPGHATTTWVSVPQDGNPADDDTFEPTIDASGSEVAWVEENDNFGFGMGSSSQSQVFVRNLATHATTLVSTGPSGPGNSYSEGPSLSDNGSLVSFESQSTNLPGAVAGFGGVFVRNLSTATTVVGATRNGSAAAGDFGAEDGSISGNGDCVAFDSSSDDLVSGGYSSDFNHVFLHALNGACPPVVAPPPTPTITKLSVTHKRFALGAKATALTASHKRKPPPRGTTFKFKLNVAASTRIVITRKHKTLLTLVRKHTRAGANSVAFSGRYGKKHLAPGTYTATVTATGAAGKRSKPRSVKFTVVK